MQQHAPRGAKTWNKTFHVEHFEMKTRSEAVEYALTWKGTPYVTGARVCQGGCDCTWISEYLIYLGAAQEIPLFTYAQDWFCHSTEERYFDELSKYAVCKWKGRCVGTPPVLPGDIALFRCNLTTGPSPRFNHGCIFIGWPRALHTFRTGEIGGGVRECRPSLLPLTAGAEMAIFDPWEDR